MLVFGALLVVGGCTNDLGNDVLNDSSLERLTINIDGSIHQSYTTRVDDGGFCDGDEVGLYAVNYSDKNATAGTLLDEGNQVDNARYTFDESAHKRWLDMSTSPPRAWISAINFFCFSTATGS